jgi:methionine-rich copper-binding protein CopC
VTVFPLAAAQPAAAHDVIETVEPADGAVVAAVPGMVRLTFNRTPIAIGSQILVNDENGTNQADGPVVIVDSHVAQAIKAGAPAGRYRVLWRVVSSDSHPIEGSFTFTAGQANGTPHSGTAQPATSAPVQKSAKKDGFPWGVAAGGMALAAGLIAVGAYVRRRLAPNDDATRTGNES